MRRRWGDLLNLIALIFPSFIWCLLFSHIFSPFTSFCFPYNSKKMFFFFSLSLSLFVCASRCCRMWLMLWWGDRHAGRAIHLIFGDDLRRRKGVHSSSATKTITETEKMKRICFFFFRLILTLLRFCFCVRHFTAPTCFFLFILVLFSPVRCSSSCSSLFPCSFLVTLVLAALTSSSSSSVSLVLFCFSSLASLPLLNESEVVWSCIATALTSFFVASSSSSST